MYLVFLDKILFRWVKGSFQTRGKRRAPLLKRHYSTVIGLSTVKMVADRHRHAAYHNKH